MNTAGPKIDRSSGILLHITSLPGPHGVGDLGPAAYWWIDQLARAKQSWWQMLPLGPTGYADSPYQCFSAFAGNVSLISLDLLVSDDLLFDEQLPTEQFISNAADFDRAKQLKLLGTEQAFARFRRNAPPRPAADFAKFKQHQAAWLDPFALFVALKDQNTGGAWWDWPRTDRIYNPAQADRLAQQLANEVELCKFRQFLFFRQWEQLRAYAHRNHVRLIGDMPIFISADSSDVWSKPELFQLDQDRRPTFVAGVPPDYFSATGQLWGNPLYDWEMHRQTGYAWWIDRLRSTLEMVDLVRLDHFRGFEAYWAVPAGDPTAENGSWQPGPGPQLFRALLAAIGPLPLIAEDLGVITPEVDALRHQFGLPGMRVLQFAFSGAQEDRFFPHHFDCHTVVYTGTHDNETTVGWYNNLIPAEQTLLEAYAPGATADPAWAMLRLAWGSVADLAIAPLQDVLRLGNEARMNYPGRTEGNWRWRLDPALLTEKMLADLAEMTTVYQRQSAVPVTTATS